MKGKLRNLILVCISILVTLVFVELAYRTYKHEWRFINFIEETLESSFPCPSQFDSLLGWIPKEGTAEINNYWKKEVTVLKDGIRSNGKKSHAFKQPGTVLAIGDSFTFGDTVSDEETWPAVLERLSGQKVINAGVYGYGIDQMILRMNTLLGIYKPETVIFSFIPEDLVRSSYKIIQGASKPYFCFCNKELILNKPEPTHVSFKRGYRILGYSYFIHRQMMHVNPSWWVNKDSQKWERADNEMEMVNYFLLKQLENIRQEYNIKNFYVLIQYPLNEIDMQNIKRMNEVRSLCLNQENIHVIDLGEALWQARNENPAVFYSLFNSDDGHMTSEGNTFAAEAIFRQMYSSRTFDKP